MIRLIIHTLSSTRTKLIPINRKNALVRSGIEVITFYSFVVGANIFQIKKLLDSTSGILLYCSTSNVDSKRNSRKIMVKCCLAWSLA